MNCKAAIAFFQYSVLANFYWLLVEGMYLQTLLLLTFTSDKSYIWWYILIGWGECAPPPSTSAPSSEVPAAQNQAITDPKIITDPQPSPRWLHWYQT